MKKILLVKTSSLGDVVHTLPVASDIRTALPGAEIDWVVEESFAAIPRLHPAVTRVIPVAMRRWRKALWRRQVWDEMRAFLRELRRDGYDAVIDSQGLLKSALITRAARGQRYGLDWASAREPLAVFYDRTFSVPWTLHAVERNRSLAARALGYALLPAPDYGIRAVRQTFPWLKPERYAVLLHAASAVNKLWSEDNWIAIGTQLAQHGVHCVLPWGNAPERTRSERLAARLPLTLVPPAVLLADAAALLAGAQAVVGVDTGLTHLAAALGSPTVGVYCATDPAATGIYGCVHALNLGGIGSPPTVDQVVSALERLTA